MPAGVGWGKYLTFSSAAMLAMFAGAQVVHSIYRPLDDLDKLIKLELEKHLKEKPD
ncbi:ubiquinol-cytochrome-c reductase complex assembly factor 6 [Halyomorpha halys]|uniref:ubiquinol-cytochrome-c reductase complex assembly factor 6 n=1 Tax=Halyomorpha halys TaxID=286706 RepID=UPI0006D4ECE3|nr:uncharacterized protein C12orf73 homolog [Halyomorpha halys]